MVKISLVLTPIIVLGAYMALSAFRGYKYRSTIYGESIIHGAITKQANGSVAAVSSEEFESRCIRTKVVNIDIHRANGSTVETVNLEEFSGSRLSIEIELKVEYGNVRIEFLDNKEKPKLSVAATPEKPALMKSYLTVNASDRVKYQITSTKAQNISYSLTLERIE